MLYLKQFAADQCFMSIHDDQTQILGHISENHYVWTLAHSCPKCCSNRFVNTHWRHSIATLSRRVRQISWHVSIDGLFERCLRSNCRSDLKPSPSVSS
jgi:hypothetical protein